MLKRKFFFKIGIKCLVFTILSAITLVLIQTPVITNKIAMGQMENSDELYVLMETYYKMVSIIQVVYGLIAFAFVAWIAYDIYIYIKNLKEKKDDEKIQEH
jgi:hypothetical protein